MSDWKKHLVKVSKTISIRNNDINYHTFTYKNEKKILGKKNVTMTSQR